MPLCRSRSSQSLVAVLSSFVGDLFSSSAYQSVPSPVKKVRKSKTTSSLPPIETVLIWFNEMNQEFFEGKLPKVSIIYSSRMRAAGSYTPSQKTIRLGIPYHELFPEQLKDTLKHEMIHILNPTHNRHFKAEAARIGASRYATSHPSLLRPAKFLYHCPQCSLEYPRRKRLRMAHCGKCAKGDGLHKGNKLLLVKSVKIERLDDRDSQSAA